MPAPFNCQNRPSKLTRASVQSAFISRSPSLNRATTLVGSTWNAENIRPRPPMPTPISIRPRLSWSSALRSLARWTGLRNGVTNTTQPRRMRSVLLRLAQRFDVRAVERVTRETKVSNGDDAAVGPVQEDEVHRASGLVLGIDHEDRRTSVHEPRDTPPVGRARISMKVVADLGLSPRAQPIDQVEPNVVGQHVAYGIEVSCVEARGILEEACALERRQYGRWDGIGFARQFAQARASSLQRRLEDASARDLAEFRQRIAEHIDENHRATLRGREAHKRLQARDRGERVSAWIRRIGDQFQVFVVGKGGRVTRAPAEKIQSR